LAVHFLEQFTRELGKGHLEIAPEAIHYLESYDWPGNVRELAHEIKRLVVLTRGPRVTVAELSPEILNISRATVRISQPFPKGTSMKAAVEQLEQHMLQEALVASGYNQVQAARKLGLSRQGLIKKLKRYSIAPRPILSKYSSSRLSIQMSGGQGRRLGHHLGYRLRGPVERMRLLIPFTDKLLKLRAQVILRGKVHNAQSLALQDAEPLFHLIHPRTVHGREVHHKPRVRGEPSGDFFSVMRTHIVTHEMNRPDVGGNLPIQMFQKGAEFLLAFAGKTLPVDLARTGIKGREEVEGAGTCVLMLVPIGQMTGLGGPRGGRSRPWLQGGLLVDGKHQLILRQRPGVEVDQLGNGRIEDRVPRPLGVEPNMMPPGLELVRGQNASDGGGGDLLHDLLGDELARQFGAIPLGEATSQRIRAFAGQAYHVDRDFGGKTPPWRLGRGHPRALQDAGPESAWPTCGRRAVEHQPTAPRRIGNPQKPATG
jgi:Bacterial regulatory protein, Fis family